LIDTWVATTTSNASKFQRSEPVSIVIVAPTPYSGVKNHSFAIFRRRSFGCSLARGKMDQLYLGKWTAA